MRLIEEHSWLIGKVAKLHSSAVAIEQGYTEAIGIGDVDKIDKLYWRCDWHWFSLEQLIVCD